MPRDDDQSLGDQQTYEGGAQPADSSDRSLGDQSTFGGGGESSLSDIGGLTGDADLDMEIVDLSRYEVQESLGKGGMGEVLLATDTRLNRKVAIKRMLGDAAKSQTAVRRFLTEAQSIAALNHFNIVQIHDYGRDKDGPFLIMEYVGGGSLLDKCREGALPLEEAVELTCQLCDGLSKAHDAGIIHRDIKPANILLTTDGLPKLTDFGLARQDTGDTGQTMAGAVLGTLDFMPPEQRRDATLTDNRSDLWALAATLYQLVTGEPPRVIDLDEVPQQLRPCLAQALKQKQDDRYQTAAEFRDALRASQQDTGSEELEEGSCPSCGTKNPTNRKFCRECAASLEAECLSCSAVMPLWEKVCDSCGTKQADLLQERRDSMVSSQSGAESLLKSFDFDRSTELATALRDEPDLRLQHLKGWAEKFLPQIDQGRQQQLEQIGGQLTEAAAHEQAHDYAAGLRVLEKVPEILREAQVPGHSDTVAGVMSRLQSTLDEIKRLDTEIRQRVKTRKVDGLLSELNQLQDLQPDRKDIIKLKTQLLERERKLKETRDEAYPAAKQKLSAQDYDGVLEEVARIDKSMLGAEIKQLRDEAIEKRDRLKSLRAAISEGVKTKQLHGLLKKVDECLSLKSGDAELEKLRGQLQAREEKNAAQVANVIEKAQGLREVCQFEAASNALGRIPQELMTQEASDLLEDCDSLAGQRETAMHALEAASDETTYQNGVKDYRNTIRIEHLVDAEFSARDAEYLETFKEIQRLAENAKSRQALMKKLAIAGTAATAVVLLIAAGLWIRSSMNASALAEAARVAAEQARVEAEAARIEAEAARIAEQRVEAAIESMSFKLIPAGTFTMGDKDRRSYQSDLRQVTLTKAFELGVHEVTQEQYWAVMGTNPSYYKGPQNPVEEVSWNDAVEFCRKLSERPEKKLAGYVYRLPTEAEWEYACRAGTTTRYSFGDSDAQFGYYAWYKDNSGRTTHPVGGKHPNPWGLYDMHGNVSEWCQDTSGRGGSWNHNSGLCRSADRHGLTPDDRYLTLGFRVLRSSIK